MPEPTLTTFDASAGSAAHQRFRQLRLEAFTRRGLVAEERHIVRRDGRRSYALLTGEGDRPTLFLHGGAGNTAEWADVAPLVSGPVVVVDTPGFGLSEPPASGFAPWGPVCATWLLDVADALGASRLAVVGGSMGGYAAISFAAAHPHRIAALTLAGSAGGLFTDIGLFLRLWTVPGVGKVVSNLPLRDIETLRKKMFGPYVGDETVVADDLLAVALAGVNLPRARAMSRAVIRSVANTAGWRPEARADDLLVGADVPTTFVWGDGDIHAAPEVAHRLAARMSDAKVVIIPGAGHIPHLDHPEAVAAAIR